MQQDSQEDIAETGSEQALTGTFVREQWRITERRRKNQAKMLRKNKAAYESRMWRIETTDATISESQEEGPITSVGNQIVVEVSRMPTIIQTYTGYLFPRAPRTVVTPDADGRGEPTKAQMTANRWLSLKTFHEKASAAVGQSLLYPGCAMKLGLDMTKALPQDRVYAKVVPWWDLVLDWDVQDKDEQRFIGHSYWEDVAVLEKRFGKKIPEDVKPQRRDNYLDRSPEATRSDVAKQQPATGERFVQVLEWYNLVDDFELEGGGTLRGVFEVYLVEQLTRDSAKPFMRNAMPYHQPNGEPAVPLFPLIFDSEKEHPLRGIPLATRIYPQCYEIAMMRSAFANGLRRNARVLLVDKGSMPEAPEIARLVKGEDGVVLQVEKPEGKTWEEVVKAFQFPPQTQDFSLYEGAVERDLAQGVNAPKFSRGEASGARTTAYEVQTINSYMENRFGELARIKDSWLADIARGLLRVFIAAMKYPASMDEKGKRKPDTVKFVDKKRVVVVTHEDLDGDFDINIADAASTPMTREARRADITSLMPALLDLWEKAQAGNPMAVVILNSLTDLYDLPADYGYANLQEMAKKMAEDAAAEKEAMGGAGAEGMTDERKAKALQNLQALAQAGQLPAPQGAPPEAAMAMEQGAV